MNLISKMICLTSAVLFSASAFAAGGGLGRIDILGYGGYTQADQWSETSVDNKLGKMTGFNGGAMMLVTLMDRVAAPVIGIGGNYMQLKSSTKDSTGIIQIDNTLTSGAGTVHAGLRVSAPMVKFFLLGNGGYGLSDKIETKLSVPAPYILTTPTINTKLKNHIFYGGTAAFLISAFPFMKVGLSGVYNMHSASFEDDTAGSSSQNVNYQEISGNLVIDVSL